MSRWWNVTVPSYILRMAHSWCWIAIYLRRIDVSELPCSKIKRRLCAQYRIYIIRIPSWSVWKNSGMTRSLSETDFELNDDNWNYIFRRKKCILHDEMLHGASSTLLYDKFSIPYGLRGLFLLILILIFIAFVIYLQWINAMIEPHEIYQITKWNKLRGHNFQITSQLEASHVSFG